MGEQWSSLGEPKEHKEHREHGKDGNQPDDLTHSTYDSKHSILRHLWRRLKNLYIRATRT